MKRQSVLLVFGGESSEHDVSVKSAHNVFTALDTTVYEITLAYIDRDGRWWLLEEWMDEPDQHGDSQLIAAPGTKHFLTVPGSRAISVDVIFPILHGKHGEDGSIQGLADTMHLPIVGCGIEASAICMNKNATKWLLKNNGIPVVPWTNVYKGTDMKIAAKEIKQLSETGPWFVKPARAGSSIGVSKVVDIKEMKAAIDLAHQHDDLALVETAIRGRELEIAMLGNPPNHKASAIGEILVGDDFYDYEEKYSDESKSTTSLDVSLPKGIEDSIRQHAMDAFRILRCTGLARIDFFLSDDSKIYLNEVNTLPGFTNISMYPKLWQQAGLSHTELTSRLIQLAFENDE